MIDEIFIWLELALHNVFWRDLHLIKDIELILEIDICFTVHPFKRDGIRLPFTMVSCIKGNKQADSILFLNHEKKEFYMAPNFAVSEYLWTNNDDHRLYFIAGIDDIYTIVHENITQGLTKVPCCYEHPDYVIGFDPNLKILELIEFLMRDSWKKNIATKTDNSIMNIIKDKILNVGMTGGKYNKKESE